MTILERIDAGDADGVLDSIAGMTAAERSAAYARVTPEVERLHELVHVQGQQWAHPNGTDAQRRAAAAAVLGLATGEQMGGRRFGDAALIADAVRRCAPGWATPEGLRTCTERSTSFFPTIALLVREGLAAWPEGDAVVEHVASVGFRSRVPLVDVVRDRLAGTLDFLYRLFEVEGGQTTSLASCDKYRRDENKWSTTLLALSATGELDRDRLLTASLEALERDFAPFRAGWYKRFHDALKPTPADRAARKDHYVRLLGSAVPQTVSFAVGQVDRLARKKLVGDEALDALRPVMTAKAKATVVKAVKLAQRLARTPEETTLACELLLDALLHEEVAVQEAALDALDALLPKASEPERLRASLADSRPLLRPSLRGRLPEVEAPADEPDTVVPVRVDPLHPSRALAGMPSLAETVQLAAEGLEVPDPLVLERAWAGMVHHRVDEDTVAAVRKRARKLLDAANANDRVMRSAHARLVLVWAGETLRPWPGWMPQTPAQGFFLGYHAELAARVADDDPTPLLSTPSHQDGWLHPDVLTSRLTGRPGRHELALAAHRLPDDARARLGVPPVPARTWSFEVQTRTSGAYSFRALHRFPVPVAEGDALTDHLANSEPFHAAVRPGPELAWFLTATPTDPRWCLADGAVQLSADLDNNRMAAPHFAGLRPYVPAGHELYMLIAVALAAKGASARASAADALVDTITDGRFDAAEMGAAWAALFPTGLIGAKRAAGALNAVVSVSPMHAGAVREAMTASLRGDPAAYPGDIGTWLGLMVELYAERGTSVTDPNARTWLTATTRGGSVRKHRKRLLG
jgi:hypothetical protein